MADTDTMTNNAVRCNGNRTSNGNRVSNGNRTSNGNGMSDSNGTSNGMADNAVANSDSDIRVGSSAVVGDLGNEAVGVVGMVVDVLDPAVREVDGVGAFPETGPVIRLSLLEGSSRKLISNTILVRVGGDLGQVVVADSVGHWVSHGSMHHRPGYGHRSSNCNAMANKTMSSDKTMSAHKTMSSDKTTSSQQLGCSIGGSSQGRNAKEGL